MGYTENYTVAPCASTSSDDNYAMHLFRYMHHLRDTLYNNAVAR